MKKLLLIFGLSLILQLVYSMEEDQIEKQLYSPPRIENKSDRHQSALNFINFYVTEDISKYKKILHLGCRSGKITASIAKFAPKAKIVGIDSSEPLIKKAKKDYQDNKSLTFLLSNAHTKRFKKHKIDIFKKSQQNFNQDFDAVFSFSCSDWQKKNKKTCFNNIAQALKKSGIFYMTMSAKDGIDLQLAEDFFTIAATKKWKNHFKDINFDEKMQKEQLKFVEFNQSEIENLFKNSGLKPLIINFVERKIKLKNIEEFELYMISILFGKNSPIANLDQELKIEFIKEILDRYKPKIKFNNDGSFEYIVFSLYVKAQKL